MILQLGAALLMIWVLNIGFMVYQVVRHTPNWKDDDVDVDEIAQNFMKNAPLEQIQMIHRIEQMNPFFGYAGVIFLLAAMVI